MPIGQELGGYPDENMTHEQLVDHVANLQKTIEYYLGGQIDSTNAREFGGFYIKPTTLSSKSGNVGLSSASSGPSAVRIWAGNADMTNAPFRVYDDGHFVATNATLSGTIDWSLTNTDPVASGAASTANSASYKVEQIANGTYTGGTFITGTTIYSPTIMTGTNGKYLKLSGSQLQSVNGATKDGFTLDGTTGYLLWYSAGTQTGGIYKDTSQGYEQLLMSHDYLMLNGVQAISMSSSQITIGDVGGNVDIPANVNFLGAVSGANFTAKFG